MSYHWSEVAILWAALDGDYEAINKMLGIMTTKALQDFAVECRLISEKAETLYFKKVDEEHGLY